MAFVRPPAVAGLFYPADPSELAAAVHGHLAAATPRCPRGGAPKALIAPHAGYVYSGPVAGSAYACLKDLRAIVTRVVLIGPAHCVALRGLALSGAESFATPLGTVPVYRPAVERLLALPQVQVLEAAHRLEHGLEVHLPFLQASLDRFTLVPLVAGEAPPEAVAAVLEPVWGGPETLVVVSSDLSHYYDAATARRLDAATAAAIEALRPEAIGAHHACGRSPIQGLLQLAKQRGLAATTLDLRNSGDTAGPRGEVVGYGAFIFS